MSYQEVYKQKLTTADEAVKAVKSGDWVDYGWSVCSADALDKALARRMGELTDVKIRGGILTHKPAIFDVPNAAEHFCWNSWHMGGIERKAVSEGFSYYIPLRYSELPGYYRNCIKSLDVAMFQVAPMDEHGWFNFGPGGSHLKAVCECAKTVIVEGIAASAASVIMCAGDEVQVYPGSMVMIHGVSGLLWDYYNLQDLKKLQKDFDASERAIAEIYHAKTGIEVDQLRSMMTRETWMVGQEAIDNGFIFDIIVALYHSADSAVVRICRYHTNIVFIQKNSDILLDNTAAESKPACGDDNPAVRQEPADNPGYFRLCQHL